MTEMFPVILTFAFYTIKCISRPIKVIIYTNIWYYVRMNSSTKNNIFLGKHDKQF